ncbi:MAG: T9SS type A sorting domain-containing protein [bacterium]|nr:T9SS type A sorting domain-containing protein [bacterium]
MLVYASTATLINNTIAQNRCTNTSTLAKGGGLSYYTSGTYNGVNNILYGNTAPVNPEFYGTVNFNYSDCSVPLTGTGNLTDDPQFVDLGLDNFHLLAISPCIDTGDPTSPLDPDGTTADMGALFFEQTGGALLIPNRPTDFDVAHNNAQLIATLSWTNPSLTANNQPLTELSGIKVYRNNVLLTTLTNVQIGQPSTYDDTSVPAAGMYQYKVAGFNSHGDGIPALDSCWIGLDVPATPSNVAAAVAGLNVNLTWTAPTQGSHHAYWPAGSWTGQRVYRNGTLITTLNGTNTTYVDTPPVEGDYIYGVTYFNTSGEGPVGEASSVHAGPVAYYASVTPYVWIEINPNQPGYQYTGTNTGLTADDQNLGPFNLGFSYSFYGNTYSSFRVCSNGWASFNSALTSYSNVAIPSTSAPFNLLGVYWDDMNMSTQGTCWYYYDATNGRCIIEWDNVAHYGTTPPGNYTMEIIVYQTGVIEYMYKSLTPGTANSATIGIQNATGTTGLQCCFNGAGSIVPTPRSGIRFSPPGPTQLDINTSPVNPPITIPANGGNFQYNINIHNIGAAPATIQVWNKVRDAGNSYTLVFGPLTRILPGGANPSRVLTQTIAGSIPSGMLSFISYVGTYPNTVADSSFFTITKSTVSDGGAWIAESYVTGDVFDEFAATNESTVPETYSLGQNYPNPFNPLTTISFALPQAGKITLVVYDVTGREVARLLDGWRTEGIHQVTFDATGLASGVYLYRLTAGDFTAGGKMVLLK